MRSFASAFGPAPGFDFCRSARSGSRYSARPAPLGVEERPLRVLVGSASSARASDGTSGGGCAGRRRPRRGPGSPARRRRAARPGCRPDAADRGCGSTSSARPSGARRCGSRAAADAASRRVRTACPERRTSAPSDAPVRKSTPTSGEQDAEDRRAGRADAERDERLEAVPTKPPWALAEREHQARRRSSARPSGTGARRRARCASRSARRPGTSTTGAR